MSEAWIGLVRGINVGGRHKLPMADLARMYTEAGARDVKTYIQSGNVRYRAAPDEAVEISERVSAAIAASFGFSAPIVERSAEALAAAVAANPFAGEDEASTRLHVVFLSGPPPAERVAALNRSGRDRFEVIGREIYLCCVQGIGKSDLPSFDRLGVVATARNWRTTLALLALARG